jgi:adenine-specific DNA-methyltransferase
MDEKEKTIKELTFQIEKLKNQIKEIKAKKKYGLVWDEKESETVISDCQKRLPILSEIEENEIITDQNGPINIMIEGDNYHSLSVLNYTHKEKIDVIYIDPPYNTGSESFLYNDNRYVNVNSDDPYKHSKWISFIAKRLKLAKGLLKDDGIIFISIDINELAQLKLLCDEIFDNNLVSLITVKVKDPAGVGQQSTIFDVCEYVLAYAKNINQFKKAHTELPMDYEPLKEQYGSYNNLLVDYGKPNFVKEIDRKNVGKIRIYSCQDSKVERTSDMKLNEYIKNRNKVFASYNPSGGMIVAIRDEIPKTGLSYIEHTPTKGKNAGKLTKTYFLNGRILSWLGDITTFDKGQLLKQTKMTNVWDIPNASLYLEGGVDFVNGKKPLRLLIKLLNIVNRENMTVLDFFAGSGSTGEAVLDLNKVGGDKKFILCTNNEGGIAKICHKRIFNAIKGYNSKAGDGGNLKYFKTDFVDVDALSYVSDEQRINLTYRAGEMIALKEDTFEEVEKNEWWQIFTNGIKQTAIYFKEDKSKLNKLVKQLSSLKSEVALYIFSWGKNEYANEYSDYVNIRVEDIPEPIIKVYEEINKLA